MNTLRKLWTALSVLAVTLITMVFVAGSANGNEALPDGGGNPPEYPVADGGTSLGTVLLWVAAGVALVALVAAATLAIRRYEHTHAVKPA